MKYKNEYSVVYYYVASAFERALMPILILYLPLHFNIKLGIIGILISLAFLIRAICSLLIGWITKYISHKHIILIICTMNGLFSLLFPFFIQSKIFLAIFTINSGLSFACSKISSYSLLGQLVTSRKRHASIMSFMDGGFTLYISAISWIFAAGITFIEKKWVFLPWINTFILFIALIAVSKIKFTKTKQSQVIRQPLKIKTIIRIYFNFFLITLLTMLFFVRMFEAGNMWLAYVQNIFLHIKPGMALIVSSTYGIYASSGRFISSYLLNRYTWIRVFELNIFISMAILSLMVFFLFYCGTEYSILGVPIHCLMIPLLSFSIAPFYSLICSRMLTHFSPGKQTFVAVLITFIMSIEEFLFTDIFGFLVKTSYGFMSYLLTIGLPILVIVFLMGIYYRKCIQLGLTK